jgi:predicted ATPase
VRFATETILVGERLHVVSGCSGSGKSTLIAALAERGESVSEEPGRQIVKEQIRIDGDGLPWTNPQRFMDLCAAKAIADFDLYVRQSRRTFFDRRLGRHCFAPMRSVVIPSAKLWQSTKCRRYRPASALEPSCC